MFDSTLGGIVEEVVRGDSGSGGEGSREENNTATVRDMWYSSLGGGNVSMFKGRYVWGRGLEAYLSDKVRSLDVHTESPVEVLFCSASKVLVWQYTSIQHQDINLAKLGDGLGDETLGLCNTANVGPDGVAAVCAKFLDKFIGRCGVTRIVDNHRCASSVESLNDSLSDTLGRSSNQCDFSGERHDCFKRLNLGLKLGEFW